MVRTVTQIDTLSPDGSGRFFIMARLLGILTKKKKSVTLLDVGGSSPYMSKMLETLTVPFELTTIDILPKPKNFRGTYVQGNALAMSFESESYDTVISTDVLEHIPALKKIEFVQECLRVAKDYVIIAAPFDTEGVDAAEHATNDFNIQLFKEGQSWLEEHFEFKKPNLDEVLNFVKKEGFETEVIGSNNVYNWLLSTHTNLMEAKLGLGNKELAHINKRLNQSLLQSNDMTGPFYRHFIVIAKNKFSEDMKAKIHELKNPTIKHEESVAYVHSLLSLVTNKIKDSEVKLKSLEKSTYIEIDELKKQISILEEELVVKQSIIDKCRPYLLLLRGNPFPKVRRLIKPKSK